MSDNLDRIALLQQLGRTYRTFLVTFEREVGECLPRLRILRALSDQTEPCSQKQLAETLQLDPGALSRQLKSLEALGWISRSLDTGDNRLTNVVLTPLGKRIEKKTRANRDAFVERTLGDVPDEQLHQLMQALSSLEACFRRAGQTKD